MVKLTDLMTYPAWITFARVSPARLLIRHSQNTNGVPGGRPVWRLLTGQLRVGRLGVLLALTVQKDAEFPVIVPCSVLAPQSASAPSSRPGNSASFRTIDARRTPDWPTLSWPVSSRWTGLPPGTPFVFWLCQINSLAGLTLAKVIHAGYVIRSVSLTILLTHTTRD